MKEYEVELSSGVTTTMLLDDETAKAMGAKPVSTKAVSAPKNKAAKSDTKEA
jgi:hypothetical protein